ncbi:helix-turn-helix domain-containing protein [Kocuria sp.]|uniref:helix-turn-helix domain-containing protein n=1 Tax=Kocuria sp. TaxID=1871328 RepID=UPI0026DFEFB5|nr:helix-turn-helix domain-containing protein [Kocuria sp.]MDO5619597.1 helix-turn-helix domain-containing protein [Kocuria sp.]
MTQDNQRAGLEHLLRQLRADQSIVEETVSTILSTVPGYDGVSRESLERSVRRNVQMSIRALQGKWSPRDAEIPEADALATERLSQGVALSSLLAGFRVSLSTILRRVLQLAPDYQVSAQEALGCSTVLWDLGDSFSARAMDVYQRAAIREAVVNSARRHQWIADAVTQGLPRVELLHGAATYGVPDDQWMRAVAIGSQASEATATMSELQQRAARSGLRLWLAPHASGVVGAVLGTEDQDLGQLCAADTNLTLALGHQVVLGQLPESYADAVRVQRAAAATGRTGLVDARAMSWRMAIPASPETTDWMQQRWLIPVLDQGEFGASVLESVAAYINNGQNIPRAAAAIPVHVNTLRYRLRRFEDLTGADFQDVDCLIEVAWALAPGASWRPATG